MYDRFISSSMLTGCCEAANSVIGRDSGFWLCDSWSWDSGYAIRARSFRRGPNPEPRIPSDVQVLHVQRVILDELPPRLDLVAHQRREHQVGFGVILGADLEQRPDLRIHRRLPELL